MTEELVKDVENLIRALSQRLEYEIIELNVQIDHVLVLVMIPVKLSLSSSVEQMKERVAIGVFNKYKKLRQKPYLGN